MAPRVVTRKESRRTAAGPAAAERPAEPRTAADPSVSTRMRLLLAAERLIADGGVAQVSMRRINLEAGAGNISAVHYHFGSLERVVEAILELRVPPMNDRRNAMLDELRGRPEPPSVNDVLQAVVWPLAEQLLDGAPDNCYVRFLAAVNRVPSFEQRTFLRHRRRRGLTRCYVLLRRAFPAVPKDVLHARIMLGWREVVHTLADVDAMIRARHPALRDALVMFHATDLITRIGQALGAPVSEATQMARRMLLSKAASEKGTVFGMDAIWAPRPGGDAAD